MTWRIDMGGGKSSSVILEEKAPTLCTTHYGEPAVAYLANGGGGDQVCPTLVGAHERMVSDYTALVLHEPMVQLQNNQNNSGIDDGKVAFTLTASMGEGGGWTPMVAYAVHENQHATCTLNAVHPALTTGGGQAGAELPMCTRSSTEDNGATRPNSRRQYEATATATTPAWRSRCGERPMNEPEVYDARGNGDGSIAPTLTGDHENRITDYTAIILIKETHDDRTDKEDQTL